MQVSELLSFLETAGKKGFLTQSVLKQTQTAIDKMKTVIDSDPDQPSVNLENEGVIEDLFRRFMTINAGELSPESANVYVSRVKKAIDNCARYNQDPLSYKSTFAMASGSKSTSAAKSKDNKKQKSVTSTKTVEEDYTSPNTDSENFLATYPLRRDFLLNMQLPKDLNTQEVKRLAFYLLSLCGDFNPVKTNIFSQEPAPNYSALDAARNN